MGASGGPSSTGAGSVAGAYRLTSMNGAPLPFVISSAGPEIDVLADLLVLSADGTFTQSGTYRITSWSDVTTQGLTDAGSFMVHGTAVSVEFRTSATAGCAFTMTE